MPPKMEHRGTMAVLQGNNQGPSAGSEEGGGPMDTEDLRHIFKTYDKDESGQISKGELKKAVKAITGISPSPAVVASLLGDIDMDEDGQIDEDEFVEFFGKMNDLLEMEKELTHRVQRGVMVHTLMKVYFVANFCAFFFFVVLWVEDNANDGMGEKTGGGDSQSSTLSTIGFVVSGASLVAVIIGGLLYPICKIKLAPAVKKLENKIMQKVGVGKSATPGRQFPTGTLPSAKKKVSVKPPSANPPPSANSAKSSRDNQEVASEASSATATPRPPLPAGPRPDEYTFRRPPAFRSPNKENLDNENLETLHLPEESVYSESHAGSQYSTHTENIAGLSEWGYYNKDGYNRTKALMHNTEFNSSFCANIPQTSGRDDTRPFPGSPLRPRPPAIGWAQPGSPAMGMAQTTRPAIGSSKAWLASTPKGFAQTR